MYEVLIVEDEALQREALVKILSEYNESFHIHTASDYSGAVAIADKHSLDMVFIDLKLDDELDTPTNGLHLGLKLRSALRYQYTPIIFVTSVPDLIHEALSDVGCFRYILKPYTSQDIAKCLENLLHSPLVPPPTFCFRNYWGGTLHIPESSILYFHPGMSRRLEIATKSGMYETTDYTLSQLTDQLNRSFLRCHRKYLVNVSHITDYECSNHRLFMGDLAIPVGRSYKPALDAFWRK